MPTQHEIDAWSVPQDRDAPALWAIDPGDEHVGLAAFVADESELGWRCFKAGELTPDQFADLYAWFALAGLLHTVVFERFRLYADKAEEQRGSEFLTSQLIGVIKWVCRQINEHAELHVAGVNLSCMKRGGTCGPDTVIQQIKVVSQQADVKKPIRGILRHRNVGSWAVRHRTAIHEGKKTCSKERCHAVDAELHGWFWLLRGKPKDIEIRPRSETATDRRRS